MYQKPQYNFFPVLNDQGDQVLNDKNEYMWNAYTNCPFCKEEHVVQITGVSMMAWAARTLSASTVFKNHPVNIREFFISGICTVCWNKLFAPDDPETNHTPEYQEEDAQ